MPKNKDFSRRSAARLLHNPIDVATTAVMHRGQLSTRQAALLGLMLPPALVALYLIKSALGINMLPGPSPLHDLFYHWIR